jgi:phosphatidylserine/phosphatidylglycerophosphate/cardiolipin synthase-like enzyme
MTKKRQSKKTNQKGLLIVLAAVLVLGLLFTFTGADPLGLFTEAPTATQQIPPTATPRVESASAIAGGNDDWYEVMFVNPIRMSNADKVEYSTNGVPSEIMAGSVAERLIHYIDSAQTSIHVAAFEINLSDIANAVIRAHQRGVDVRWITDDEFGIDSDKKPGHGQIAAMKKAGIQVIDDSRSGLMHHKFWIFDGQIVWTGSTNATINGMFEQDNNVIVIKSTELASIYETQFEEMWEGEFGARSPSLVEEQSVVVNGTRMLVLFSPEDKPVQYMLPFLENARRNIRFMAFSFTQPDIGNAMLERIQSGITVEGVFEAVGSDSEYSEMMHLHCNGGAMRRDGNPGFLHHKVIIIDNRIVITGSFNFSDSANTRNNENVLIIDNADIAKLYLAEFQRIWQDSNDLDPDRFVCP